MEDAIKESLHAFSQQQLMPNKYYSTKYNKSNSFTELSDWSNRHRYFNQSIILPRIVQDPNIERVRRVVESQTSDYAEVMVRKHQISNIKSVDIKFSLPQGLKGFQKSFYENYIKQKSQRKGSRIRPSQYISIQQQLKIRSPQKSINQMKSQQQQARNSIINRVMNRKNRLKRQHFLQEYLTANSMTQKPEDHSKQINLSFNNSKGKEERKSKQRRKPQQRQKLRQKQQQIKKQSQTSKEKL